MATQVNLDKDALLDFSIDFSGWFTGGDTIIFSEWITTPEVCTSHHQWSGTTTVGWLTTTDLAVANKGYPVTNRAYSAINAVSDFDMSVTAPNTINSVTTDLSVFADKECVRVGGFNDPANDGYFKVLSATANTLVLDTVLMVAEPNGKQTCVSAGRVQDHDLICITLEN